MRNPLINRYRLSSMRPQQFLVYLATYAIGAALLLLINGAMLSQNRGYETFREMAHSLYFQFFVFQALILWFWAGHNAYSAIRDEVIDHSYDFFRLLPLSAWDKTVGILVGKNLAAFLFAAMNFAFLLACGFLGEVSLGRQCEIVLLLAVNTVFFSSASLLASLCAVQRERRRITGIALVLVLLLAVWSGLGWVFNLVSVLAEERAWKIMFFAKPVPGALFVTAVSLYLSLWTLVGVVRKFTHERETLLTTRGALLFCAGYEWLVLGLFWAELPARSAGVLGLCWLIGFLPLLMLLGWSIRSHAAYVEACGLALSRGRSAARTLVQQSNLTLGFALYGLWAVVAFGEAARARQDAAEFLGFLGVTLTAYAFVLLLVELHVLHAPSIPRLKILLGVVLVLYVVLPPIFAGIFQSSFLALHSPLVYFFAWREESFRAMGPHSVWTANLLLCAWPAYLVQKKYREILALRRQMRAGGNGV